MPDIKVYFDVANVTAFGYPEQWIRILGSRIIKLHLKDLKLEIGNIHGFSNLLQGDVNWPEVMKALREIGYDDYLVAEVKPPYRYYPERLIYETSSSIDVFLK
jgi:L-ribulose-5-phosphate 3-epimerase